MCCDANVAKQRAKGDCAGNISAGVTCCTKYGVGWECNNENCVNYDLTDVTTVHTCIKNVVDKGASLVWVGFDGKVKPCPAGQLLKLTGVYQRKVDLDAKVDRTYLIEFTSGHLVDKKRIGLDCARYGNRFSLVNQADEDGGNNCELVSLYGAT